MLEVDDWSEVERIVKGKKLVLVLVYDPGSPQGRYLSSLLDDVAHSVEPVIAVVKVSSGPSTPPGPRLLLFHEGEKVWEQIGFFFNPSSDRYAIRRGLLQALESVGLTPARLGIRLRF